MSDAIQRGLIRRQVENVTGPGMDFEEFEAAVISQVALASRIPHPDLMLTITPVLDQSLVRLYARFEEDAEH